MPLPAAGCEGIMSSGGLSVCLSLCPFIRLLTPVLSDTVSLSVRITMKLATNIHSVSIKKWLCCLFFNLISVKYLSQIPLASTKNSRTL